ncbi:MAG: zinc metallopeptidase [Clostridia bacterium]|nr:zinc metallopeptidase [Clostridia bacterium]
MFYDSTYIILIPAIIFAMYAQSRVNHAFNRYSKVRNMRGLTGAQAARRMLDANGLYDVQINAIHGSLTDNYENSLGNYTFGEYYAPFFYVIPAYKTDAKDDTVLALSRSVADVTSTGSSTVYLPFSKPVSDGVLTVEFDTVPESAFYIEYGFGLRDTENVATEFNPWTSWTDATLFGGFTSWGSGHANCVVGQRNVRNVLPAVGPLADDPTSPSFDKAVYNNWYDDATMKAREEFVFGSSTANYNGHVANSAGVRDVHGSVMNLTSTAYGGEGFQTWQTWKFVIDLDNECFDFYINDVLKKSMDYIPGGSAGTYDAFAIFSGLFANNKTATNINGSGKENVLFVDNVTVTHEGEGANRIQENSQPTIKVDGAALTDLNAITANSVVSAYADYLADAKGGKILLAAYKDGELVATKVATADATKIIAVAARGSEGFVGADTVRAFLLTNTEAGFKPLAASKTVSK